MLKKFLSVFSQYRGLSRSIYIIFFARVVTSMGAFIWPMITFIMQRKMKLTFSEIGLFSLIVGLAMLPTTFIGGKIADKFNKKKIIIIFDTISVILFISCAFMEPGYAMLIRFAIAGMFATMEYPSFESLFAEASKPNEREKVFSLSYLGMNLGLAFGAAVGGFLFENHLPLAFILDGLTTITSTIMIVLFVKPIKVEELGENEVNEYEDSHHKDASTKGILKERKSVYIMIFVAILSSFIYDQWSFTLPLYLGELFEENGAPLYGVLVSFNASIVIIFTPVLTLVLDKIKELPKMMIGIGLFSFSYLIIMYEPLKFVFFIMIFAFTIGEIVNTLGNSPFVSRRIPDSHRGRVFSYFGIAYGLGGLGGRLIAGFALESLGFSVLYMILAVVGIIALIIIGQANKIDKKVFPKLYGK